MEATKTTLLNWDNEGAIKYLWICGVGCPTGLEWRHDMETSDGEEYCDFSDLDLLRRLWGLEGTIDENGTWCWDGNGDITDDFGCTIYNVKVRRN